MWNPHGFHVIDQLPAGAKINSTYYTTNIIQPFYQAFFLQGRNPHGKQLVVHVDNCSVHTGVTTELFMKTWDMVSMPHPPYSPGTVPIDFYLFPTVKERLKHASITDKDQLFEELQTILRLISGEELERVFEAARERVHNVNQGDGDYID
jgi:hypothetical protein